MCSFVRVVSFREAREGEGNRLRSNHSSVAFARFRGADVAYPNRPLDVRGLMMNHRLPLSLDGQSIAGSRGRTWLDRGQQIDTRRRGDGDLGM